jgi:flagellar protein FlbD
MIRVTRLNGSELWVNAEMIETVEATPDTVISLSNHTKIVIKESPQDIVEAIVTYRRKIRQENPHVIEQE